MDVIICSHGDRLPSIGAVAVPNFFGEGEGQPVIISASLTGAVRNEAGKITTTRDTRPGLEMDMEHYFDRDDGGAFQTKDLRILTSVADKPGRFMIENTKAVQPDVARGTMKGDSGQFDSYGLVDLRDLGNLVGLARYQGEI